MSVYCAVKTVIKEKKYQFMCSMKLLGIFVAQTSLSDDQTSRN